MSSNFDWPRIHKIEENVEMEMINYVYDYVCEYFDVDDINELTEEQIEAVEKFRNEINEYSPLQYGFSALLSEVDMI